MFIIPIAHDHMLLGVGSRPLDEGGPVEQDGVEGVGGVEVGDEVGVAHGLGGAFEAALGGVGPGKVLQGGGSGVGWGVVGWGGG